MKVGERGAPGFSKEYINRRQRIRSEICCLAFSFTRYPSNSCPLTHSHPHQKLCGTSEECDDPYFYLHVPGWVQTLKGGEAISPAAQAKRCPAFPYVWFWFKQRLSSSSEGGGHITPSIKYSLSLRKHALKKSFVVLPLRRGSWAKSSS